MGTTLRKPPTELRPLKAARTNARTDGNRFNGCAFWLRHTLQRSQYAHLVKGGNTTLSVTV
jgi:hypothetical protein